MVHQQYRMEQCPKIRFQWGSACFHRGLWEGRQNHPVNASHSNALILNLILNISSLLQWFEICFTYAASGHVAIQWTSADISLMNRGGSRQTFDSLMAHGAVDERQLSVLKFIWVFWVTRSRNGTPSGKEWISARFAFCLRQGNGLYILRELQRSLQPEQTDVKRTNTTVIQINYI